MATNHSSIKFIINLSNMKVQRLIDKNDRLKSTTESLTYIAL